MTTHHPNLKKVVVVFKTHFDLGFTDLPDNVMGLYTGAMFSAVQETMRATQDEPENLRYTWTLPAWPLMRLLDDPALPAETREAARKLVADGRLVWHAWPFTTHTAFCGLEDLVRGMHVSRSLSERFGRWPGAAKQTDVPGHTWIFPSLLVRAGVRFLHLGCNPGSHPPDIPRLFWWEGPDGSRLLTFYSVGGYGTSPLPPPDWTHDTWLALQHTIDNHGPHSPDDLRHIREEIERGAPQAEIVFGQLHDFGGALLANPDQLADLPVLPYDLADTWIHGVGTMPREVATVRALRQLLLGIEAHAAARDWPTSDGKNDDFPLSRQIAPHIDAAYEQLMLFGEHTWGLDVKSTIKREFWHLDQARGTEPYRRLEDSWRAKAVYVLRAEEAAGRALSALGKSQPALIFRFPHHRAPGASGQATGDAESQLPYSPPPAISAGAEHALENEWLRVVVDAATGGIVSLYDKQAKREWVDATTEEPFGGYRYDIYSAADIAEFLRAYGHLFQDWFLHDFGKPGYPEETPHVTAYARDFSFRKDVNSIRLEGGRPHAPSGQELVPRQEIAITVKLAPDAPYVDLEYHVSGKVATALTESAVVPFPLSLSKAAFRLGQAGSVIDPSRDIGESANRHLWCVDGWVDASDDRVGLAIMPLDMPLVSIGDTGIYKFSTNRVPSQPTIYAHFFNNQWGTNFPQWHEGYFRFRVRLMLHAGDWRAGKVWRGALDAQQALSGLNLATAKLPIRASEGLVLLSLRPRHDGSGIIARYWDALGLPRQATIKIDGPITALWRCDLMERPVEQLALEQKDGRVHTQIGVAPHAVETLLIEFN